MPLATLTGALASSNTLLQLLQNQTISAGDATLPAFVPDFVTAVEAELTQLASGAAELEAVETAASPIKSALAAQLAHYVDDVQMAYGLRVSKTDAPAWLHAAQYEKDSAFYTRFFAGLAAAESIFLVWCDANLSTTLATAQSAYADWQASQVGNGELSRRLQRVLDLRAALAGVLRLYGLSDFAIRAAMAV